MNCLSNLFGVGGGSLISRLLGQHRDGEASRVAAFSFYGSLAISAVYSVLLYVFMDPFLRLLGATDNTIAYASDYAMWVVVFGAIPSTLGLTLSHLFRSEGYAKHSSFGLALGGVLNIALDPFLIFGWCGLPEMGIAGAAWATVVSMSVQWMALTIAAYLDSPANPEKGGYLDSAVRIIRYGIPAGLYELLNMASFTVFVFVTGGVGEVELAASNACFTINYLLFAPMMGFAIGAQTLVGQARGRGDDAEAFKILVRTLKLALASVSAAVALTLIFRHPILSIFAPENIAANSRFHELGAELMVLMATWMLFDAADIIYAGALKGAGDSRFVMWWMLLCSVVIWLPTVFIVRALCNTMPALWGTMVFYVLIICIGSAIRWHRGRWIQINLLGNK
jgi:MATE family multidrug resistance protein